MHLTKPLLFVALLLPGFGGDVMAGDGYRPANPHSGPVVARYRYADRHRVGHTPHGVYNRHHGYRSRYRSSYHARYPHAPGAAYRPAYRHAQPYGLLYKPYVRPRHHGYRHAPYQGYRPYGRGAYPHHPRGRVIIQYGY